MLSTNRKSPVKPGSAGDGLGLDEERLGGLFHVPAAGGLEFQDGESLGRGIEGPVVGGQFRHPRILDAQLLAEQRDLLFGLFEFGCQADPLEFGIRGLRLRPCRPKLRRTGMTGYR